MKKGTPAKKFFPVKKVAAFRANVIQHKIDNKDIETGCHSKSYFELSLKYDDIQKKNETEIRTLIVPNHIFFGISIFFILILLKLENIIMHEIASKNTTVKTADSTKAIVKIPEQILSGTKVSINARKIIQVFFKFKFKTSNKTYF